MFRFPASLGGRSAHWCGALLCAGERPAFCSRLVSKGAHLPCRAAQAARGGGVSGTRKPPGARVASGSATRERYAADSVRAAVRAC
ncbi:hypothetical protein FA95DRAFT_1567719 [Auriscalpium vulgare]|uniref:Uncharacterized protein n=1 Tax=Auriscalpium vulgare TaxID=40419 RepID=A0ACB8R2Z8_9AGAM|nr:hypothetical protein FA95DRAFT_1567719 [Auriscalpium vulgare]